MHTNSKDRVNVTDIIIAACLEKLLPFLLKVDDCLTHGEEAREIVSNPVEIKMASFIITLLPMVVVVKTIKEKSPPLH